MMRMKRKNGFVFIETMVTIVILAAALLSVYSLFNNILIKERRRAYYDDPIYMYRANYLTQILDSILRKASVNNDSTDLSSFLVTYDSNGNPVEQDFRILSCNNDIYTYSNIALSSCQSFYKNNQIYKIYVAKYDLSSLNNCAKTKSTSNSCLAYRSLNGQAKQYFKQLPYVPGVKGYYIVYEFYDNGNGGVCSQETEDKCMHQFASIRYGTNSNVINYSSGAELGVQNNHRITYNLNGGSVSTSNRTSFNDTTAPFVLNKPTKTGYVFAGWTGTGLNERTLNVRVDTKANRDYQFTANWKKQIDNNKWWNGVDQFVSLPITKNGCSLNDFIISSTNGKITTYLNISGTPSQIYAPTWPSSGSDPGTTNYIKQTNEVDGRTFNYVFESTRDANSTQYNTHIYIVCGSATLGTSTFYTQVDKYVYNKYKIIYDPQGGTSSVTQKVYNPGYNVNVATSLATKNGYTMLGWSDATDGDVYTLYRMQGNILNGKNVTLYAQWAKTSNY